MANTKFEVTIGYKAVIAVSINAETEEQAKQKALELFIKRERAKWYKRNDINLQDDTFHTYGCVNMDETWNML